MIFIDLLGFSIILLLLPYYAETFQSIEFVTGLFVTSYAAAQLIGADFGLGFNIGLVTGGLLSQFGYVVPEFVAAAISFVNFTLIYFWLSKSLTAEKTCKLTEKKYAIYTVEEHRLYLQYLAAPAYDGNNLFL